MSDDRSNLTNLVEDHIHSIRWNEETSDEIKTYVAGNLRYAVPKILKEYREQFDGKG